MNTLSPEQVSLASIAAFGRSFPWASRWPEAVRQDQPEAQRITRSAFTTNERALLLKLRGLAAEFLATPKRAAETYDCGTRSGGGGEFHFRCTTTTVIGTWHEWHPVAWWDNGEPKQWRDGALLAEAKVTYRRLQQWAESMPASIREHAHAWDRAYPVDTSDPIALTALAVSLLVDDALTPAPKPEPR
ncbi:hypothetical protein ABZ412_34325 [Nocardia sp. NPDC005746]|uniref:hypothetical protein n=1 Tax=Nocardia sp. NPDC005746 TaxID=3157062 RepID=UPI0033F59CAD